MTKYYDSSGQEIPYEQVAEQFTKQALEFSRYKQDCRKKAFDWSMEKNFSAGYEYVIKQANEYYNWLINLPQ